MSTYFALLTQVGEAKLANATALGNTLKLKYMGVGDANGTAPVPSRTQTALINERRRALLNQIAIDPQNTSQIIVEQVLPEDVGGWWIREISIYDEDNALIAVANCPPSYKPLLAEGSGRTQVVRVVLIVSSTSAIELKIDPSVVLATRKYADEKIIEVTNSSMQAHSGSTDPHPQYWNNTRGNEALSAALSNFPRCYSIASLPTSNVGAIAVIESGDIWSWVSNSYFMGYRSPLCGRPLDGHTIIPLASEVDAVGGVLSKSAYARLWAYAQENDLVVTQAVWTANRGAHYFVDVDATTFRVPDLRNVFRRYTGTDADTSTVRTLGSYKADTVKSHSHDKGAAAFFGGQYASGGAPTGTSTTGSYGTAETAPKHVAYHPRMYA